MCSSPNIVALPPTGGSVEIRSRGTSQTTFPTQRSPAKWIFSQYFYGPGKLAAERYVREVLHHRQYRVSERNIRLIRNLRALVPAFLQECLRSVEAGRYDIVGFTSTFEQNFASLCLARKIKERNPDTLIAFGGANCEAAMGVELHRNFQFIDIVASGEADISFPEMVKAVAAGRPLDAIAGLVWRREEETVVNGAAPMVRDLDALPIPDFDDYFARIAYGPLAGAFSPWLMMEASRGCWWGERSHCNVLRTQRGNDGLPLEAAATRPRRNGLPRQAP
jgi:radical SAM superfamily enzyme YgiQ (UPF0313 family)